MKRKYTNITMEYKNLINIQFRLELEHSKMFAKARNKIKYIWIFINKITKKY